MEEPVETAEPSPEVMPENPNEQLQQTIGDALAGTAAGKNLSDSDFAEILSAIVKSLSVEAPVEGMERTKNLKQAWEQITLP